MSSSLTPSPSSHPLYRFQCDVIYRHGLKTMKNIRTVFLVRIILVCIRKLPYSSGTHICVCRRVYIYGSTRDPQYKRNHRIVLHLYPIYSHNRLTVKSRRVLDHLFVNAALPMYLNLFRIS